MRLGKALATGVAEESAGSSEEELDARLVDDLVEDIEELEQPQAEVPTVR